MVLTPAINSGDATYKYKYNGKELQDELGLNWYDYGARNYDPAVGRWMNADPLSELRQWISPYNYVQNNPILLIDPNGALDAPIYDTEGSFLRTDDQGLEGKAIVMDKKDFSQGMSHDKALSKSVGAEGLKSAAAGTKLLNHYDSLKNRPDYDGVVTLSEANSWARNGNDQPLFVDVGKLDLSRVGVWGNFAEYDSSKRGVFSSEQLSENDYKWKSSIYYNFALPGAGSGNGQDPGTVFGTLKLSLLNRQTGEVKIGNDRGRLDIYNFEQQPGRFIRNSLTWIGKQVATRLGTSNITTYEIYGYGKAYVSKGF